MPCPPAGQVTPRAQARPRGGCSVLSQDSHKAPSNSRVNGLPRPEAEGPAQTLSRPSWARWVPRATPQATAPGRGQERSHLHTVSQALGGRLDSPKRPPSPTRAPSCLGCAAVGSVGIGVHAPGLSLGYPPGIRAPHPNPPPPTPGAEERTRASAGQAGGAEDTREAEPGLAPLRVRTVTLGKRVPVAAQQGSGAQELAQTPGRRPLPGPSPTHRVQLSGTGLRKHAGPRLWIQNCKHESLK